MREEAIRLAEVAVRERRTHLGYLGEVLAAEVDDRQARRRARRVAEAKFPASSGSADFDTGASTIPPPRWHASRPGRTSTPVNPWSCSVTPAPARRTC